jgi:cob(I)alamin adenosyltransferase
MADSDGFGKVHVITGPGKGKTTAAFGLAMRAAGHGYRVCVIQFLKTGETTGEVIAAGQLEGIEVLQFGTGRFIRSEGPGEDDLRAARDAFSAAREKLSGGACRMVVLDEVNVAVTLGLLSASEVLEAVSSRASGTEVVLTGRDAPAEFVEAADYVSVIENAKHPFERGERARKGVEW